MNLLVLCPHFAPDVAPTGDVMTEIVHRLADRGHRIHVVTALPWYRAHRVESGWGGRVVRQEDTDWGRISRVHPFPTDKRNLPARALAFSGFTAVSLLVGLVSRLHLDAVIAMSPPLTLGVAGWAVARTRRRPFVFNVQDIFPDVIVGLGLVRSRKLIHAARRLERAVYLGADAITVLTEDLRENVVAKLGPRQGAKVHVVPNFVDVTQIRPRSAQNGYRAELGLGDQQVVLYAGNVGMSQSLELLIEAAKRFRDRPDVAFVINGGGSAREELERAAVGLKNIRFVGFQPADRLNDVLAAGDIHCIPLKAGLARTSMPSKLYATLAAGRPLLASVDAGTEVTRVLHMAGAGICVPPDDPDAFCAALRELLDNPARARAMGSAGRRFVERWPGPSDVAVQYEELIQNLLKDRRRV